MLIVKLQMNKTIALVVAFCLPSCLLPLAARAGTEAVKPPALASYDWSAKSVPNLASNPPSADLVGAFVNGAAGNELGHVCNFRFADLRQTGNLSLIVTIDAGGRAGCNATYIFDKRGSGFEIYSSDALFWGDVQDINHDGRSELILWALMGLAGSELDGYCYWPLVFTWNGNGYSEVGSQYRRYYEKYLESLRKEIATERPSAEETQAPEAAPKPAPPATIVEVPPAVYQSGSSSAPPATLGGEIVAVPGAPPSPAPSPTPEPDYACLRVEAAKTEAFLGEPSSATMSYAIKASESNNPYHRKLAAVLFSFIGTGEAMTDLKGLAGDTDRTVADVAKERLSAGPEPDEDFRADLVGGQMYWP